MAGRLQATDEGDPVPDTPDPLADLRETDAATLPGAPAVTVLIAGGATEGEGGGSEEAVILRHMVDAETHDTMVTEAVVALHADPSALGFLHGGGQCGCRYLARLALLAVVPISTADDEEEKELEEPGSGE